MTLIERKQLKNAVEKVLHVQGNYMGGILEMAVVIDMSLSKEEASDRAKELVSILKSHSEVFRNVRLNTILWKGEQEFIKEVTPLALLQMGRFFDTYENTPVIKKWDGLLAMLKKFYARSKLIIVLADEAEAPGADGIFVVENKIEAKESMQPFLHKKLLLLSCGKQAENQGGMNIQIMSGTELFMSLLK